MLSDFRHAEGRIVGEEGYAEVSKGAGDNVQIKRPTMGIS